LEGIKVDINEIVSKVSNERQIPGRFPSRLIFVRNFKAYLDLVDELRFVCDFVIDLAAFTKGDLLPRFKDLKGAINKHPGKQILLLSFGEYLRICIKRERDKTTAAFPGIWEHQQAENSLTKFIIPIFGSREVFDSIMPFQDERQQAFIWEADESSVESEISLAIYSPDFADTVTADAENLQEWFQKWTSLFGDNKRNSFSLCTKLYRYSETTYDGIRLSVIDEPFNYVVSLVSDGEKLKETYGNKEFWKYIARNVKKDVAFAETIKYLLNIGHSFCPINLLARFGELPDVELHLLLMWYKIYPSDDYYSLAINKATKAVEIPMVLRDTIFELPKLTDAFIQQRAAALRVMDISCNESYFAKLDKISSPETRLMMLTYRTIAERAYGIKTVSGLLRSGADVPAIAELVKNDYSDLADYLNPSERSHNEVTQYFNWYRRSKLMNKPNTDAPCGIDFNSIDSRNKIMQQNTTSDSLSFWVDGLGAEWIPVLIKKLNALSIGVSIKTEVTKAILPTETEYNHKWTSDDQKWDRLDKLSHTGMPDDKDYFFCIAHQLQIMDEVVNHVAELLANFNRVIVTGDHGSSRLAALLFHEADNFAVEPPKNATVRSFGRFVELQDNSYVPITPSMERVEQDGKYFIVMKTYEHFKQPGNAAFEVHGGMTPEEYLVPVIVVSRKTPLPKKPVEENRKGITINSDQMGLP